jgi:hypothetical protein
MKKSITVIVWLCAVLCAPLASGAILSYDVVVDGPFFVVGGPPFDLPDPPGKLKAKLKVDNTKTDKDAVVDFDFVTGTKSWTENFIVDSFNGFTTQLTFAGGNLTAFQLIFLDPPEGLLLFDSTSVVTDDVSGQQGSKTIGCQGDCVSFLLAADAQAPVPGTLVLLLAGGAAAVGFARRRGTPR